VQFKRLKDEAAAVGRMVRKGAYDDTIKMARGMFDLRSKLLTSVSPLNSVQKVHTCMIVSELCIGAAYGMHLWQMGDSAQQNGAFKMALKKAKQHICLPCKIEKHDIIGLVHHAWNESF